MINDLPNDRTIYPSPDGLSPRMTLPGNIWVELWENAEPIPANRQQRLFDDTAEGIC